MNEVIADTQSIIWFLVDPVRLSKPATLALGNAAHSGRIYISVITIVELIYLEGKKNFPYPGILAQIVSLAADPTEPVELLPVTLDEALAMQRVPRNEIPDMPDRIISATAVEHKLPLVSADSDILGSASLKALVPVIW